jgi:hypothetical protein
VYNLDKHEVSEPVNHPDWILNSGILEALGIDPNKNPTKEEVNKILAIIGEKGKLK